MFDSYPLGLLPTIKISFTFKYKHVDSTNTSAIFKDPRGHCSPCT